MQNENKLDYNPLDSYDIDDLIRIRESGWKELEKLSNSLRKPLPENNFKRPDLNPVKRIMYGFLDIYLELTQLPVYQNDREEIPLGYEILAATIPS